MRTEIGIADVNEVELKRIIEKFQQEFKEIDQAERNIIIAQAEQYEWLLKLDERISNLERGMQKIMELLPSENKKAQGDEP